MYNAVASRGRAFGRFVALTGIALLQPGEYPTLLPDRRFTLMTLCDLQELAINSFPGDPTRTRLFDGLQQLLSELEMYRVEGELWIDGSFMTEKDGPSDIDVVLRVRVDHYDASHGETQLLLDHFDNNTSQYGCNVRLEIDYENHVFPHHDSIRNTSYWAGWFGTYRDNVTCKGLAVVLL